MPQYYPETRFVVTTANPDPDLRPLALYEVEHGDYPTHRQARYAAQILLNSGMDVQIVKRQWIEFSQPDGWYRADVHGKPAD